MDSFKRVFLRAIEWIVSLLLIGMVMVVFLQVINRYILHDPFSWTEEVSRFMFIWVIFLGSFLALKSHSNISVDSFITRFSAKVRTRVEVIVALLITFYLLYLTVVGTKVVRETAQSFSPSLGIPFSWFYLALPISSILMISYLITKLFYTHWTTLTFSGILVVVILIPLYFLLGAGKYSNSTLILVAIVAFIAMILINTPIAFSLGISSLLFLILQARIPLMIIPNRMMGGVDSFPFLAGPFFILAGELMNSGGITQRLVDLAKVLVGHVRGGLGMVVVVAEYFFSGISGSTVADVSAIGSLLIPAMKKAGYTSEHSVCIVSAATAMGILVPPCVAMVILGAMTGISIAGLFIGGFIPAVVLALCIMCLIYIQALKANLPVAGTLSLRIAIKAIKRAVIPLMLPVIIFAGILSGATTATEASVVAVVYSFVVGTLVYKETKIKQLLPILIRTGTITGSVLFLIATATVLSWIFATNQVPQKLGHFISSISSSQWLFVIFSNIIFVLLGAVLEGLPAMIILVPIFLPIAIQFGMDPLHYGIMIIACGGIGIFVPPIGMGIVIACSFADINIGKVIRPFMPYLIVLFAGLLIISFVPWFTLVLPNMIMPTR